MISCTLRINFDRLFLRLMMAQFDTVWGRWGWHFRLLLRFVGSWLTTDWRHCGRRLQRSVVLFTSLLLSLASFCSCLCRLECWERSCWWGWMLRLLRLDDVIRVVDWHALNIVVDDTGISKIADIHHNCWWLSIACSCKIQTETCMLLTMSLSASFDLFWMNLRLLWAS